MLPQARSYIQQKARSAFALKRPVLWDVHDTVSKEARLALLAQVPKGYRKIAVVLRPNPHTAQGRKASFPFREVPEIEPVTEDEGWDEIREQVM
jgi:hypothetical protein